MCRNWNIASASVMDWIFFLFEQVKLIIKSKEKSSGISEVFSLEREISTFQTLNTI